MLNETTNDHNNIYTRGAVYAETESNLFQLKKLSPLPHTYTEISTDSSAQYSIKQINNNKNMKLGLTPPNVSHFLSHKTESMTPPFPGNQSQTKILIYHLPPT